jgi:threonine aldolase
MAAAMLYALDHHVDRLADDHARAKRLAEGIGLDPATVETNFVSIPDDSGLKEALLARGVGVGGLRPGWLRAVTHLDIGDDDIDAAIPAMQEVLHVHA